MEAGPKWCFRKLFVFEYFEIFHIRMIYMNKFYVIILSEMKYVLIFISSSCAVIRYQFLNG